MKLRLLFKSFNKQLITTALINLHTILNNSDYKITGIVSLPTKIKKFCVLRSPHIDKDSREHFELRLYKKFIDININSIIFLDNLLNLTFPSGLLCTLKILSN
jgi:small subunit ribosomal protein S10